jgi:7-carboxy-7-deazaguanine synthase
MALLVCETFASLMGESTRVGLPAFFIRLAGCNLRCRYCDTTYAYEGGREMTVAALMEMVLVQGQRLVLVTGGEPLLQAETPALLAEMLDASFTVCLETNGSRPIDGVATGVHRILDLKCPGSGMSHHNDWRNLDLLTSRDEVKFVVANRHDFNWALEVVETHGLTERVPVLISPVFGQISLQEAAAWILDSRQPLRLNLQLHKYIWGAEARGV